MLRQGTSFDVDEIVWWETRMKESSSVFGAVRGAVPWFFTVRDTAQLAVRWRNPSTGWQARTVAGGPTGLQGDGVAVTVPGVEQEGSVSAIVRTDTGGLWEARFTAPNVEPEWTVVDFGVDGNPRYGIAAAPRTDPAPGIDVAYLKDNQVKLARRLVGDPQWTAVDWIAKPPDIATEMGGPLLLEPGGTTPAASLDPTLLMVAAEVKDVGYGFARRPGDDRWRNMLDPGISSGWITVNTGGHLTESAAEERGGIALVAAARIPENIQKPPEEGLPLPSRVADVRVAWSSDDGHNWKGFQAFDSTYAGPAPHPLGGNIWYQGDPSVALLKSDPRVGYVMFHEGRHYVPTTIVPPSTAAGCWAETHNLCASRIRLFRGTADGMTELDPALRPPSWDAVASEPTEQCEADKITHFLDHPFMATGPDDSLHISWFQDGMGTAVPEPDKEFDRLYYMVLGADGKWRTLDPIEVARWEEDPQLANPHAPYVAADPDPPPGTAVGYVAWSDLGTRFVVATCTSALGATTCESHLAADLAPECVGTTAQLGAYGVKRRLGWRNQSILRRFLTGAVS
jgi:hypothetical protein